MDDEIEFYEPPADDAPALILGKKKKKKKKKLKDTEAGVSGASEVNVETQEENVDSVPEIVLEKKKKKKKEKKDAERPESNDQDASGGLATSVRDRGAGNDLADHENRRSIEHDMTALALDVNTLDPINLTTKKKKKKKKHSNDASASDKANTQDANTDLLITNEDLDTGAPAAAVKKRKSKKEAEKAAGATKKKQQLQEDEDIEASSSTNKADVVSPISNMNTIDANDLLDELDEGKGKTVAKKKGKKKKKSNVNSGKESIDEIMKELDGNSTTETDVSKPNNLTQTSKLATGDVDDLLAEFGGDSSETKKPSASQKKKSKKKKKPVVVDTDDNIDAILNELDETPSLATVIAVDGKVPQPSDQGTVDNVDELLADLGEESGAKMTAAQKKKAKKKKKAKSADADASNASQSAQPSEPKKGKKKKESAALRSLRDQQAKIKAAEDAIRKEREEEQKRLEEEERLKKEAEEKALAERARKKAAEKARRERRRAEGTLLSKTERERRRKAELYKAQLRAQGLVPLAAASSEGQSGSQSSRKVFGNRKKKRNVPGPSNSSVSISSAQTQQISPSVPTDTSVIEQLSELENLVNDESVAIEASVSDSEVHDESHVIPDDWENEAEIVATEPQSTANLDAQNNSDDVDEISDDSEEDSSEDDSEEERVYSAQMAAHERRAAVRVKREDRRNETYRARTPDNLRSPVVCILGHVDTGKTKILDRIRRTNVQDGEAGGITQQIGATYFPIEAVKKETMKLEEGSTLSYNVPSLLIIDTPGHESFTNLRSRGSSLCDIAILVVDIMHGIEKQTLESINLLKLRKTPFIIALNKIDRMFDWKEQPNNFPSRQSLLKQKRSVLEEFRTRVNKTKLEMAQLGFNSELYWENDDIRKVISLVPTSAITGEGIPDLLMHLVSLPQKLLTERLMFNESLEATVLEVKVTFGHGITIDIILTGGTIHEGDTIMVVGRDGPITTTIRALLTPHPMKEMRVKGQHLRHKSIKAAQGVKIAADGLEKAVAGTQIVVVSDPDNEDELAVARQEVMQDYSSIVKSLKTNKPGVCVQASTLGSLEALLEFLTESKIEYSGISIGPVHKKDVFKASIQLEKNPEYAAILAFDVKVEPEAKELAEQDGVMIFTADIIYHLLDMYTKFVENRRSAKKSELKGQVTFPCQLRILPLHVYCRRNPIIVGVDVEEGTVRVGTSLVISDGKRMLDLGEVATIKKGQNDVTIAKKGDSVSIRIDGSHSYMYGRHFDHEHPLYSKLDRNKIDLLKKHFRDEMTNADWALVVKLKGVLQIQ